MSNMYVMTICIIMYSMNHACSQQFSFQFIFCMCNLITHLYYASCCMHLLQWLHGCKATICNQSVNSKITCSQSFVTSQQYQACGIIKKLSPSISTSKAKHLLLSLGKILITCSGQTLCSVASEQTSLLVMTVYHYYFFLYLSLSPALPRPIRFCFGYLVVLG